MSLPLPYLNIGKDQKFATKSREREERERGEREERERERVGRQTIESYCS
jgi:hypothetical protein